MKYEVMIRDGAGLAVWVCGWYQGEEDWNNDAPAIPDNNTATARGAVSTAAFQAMECKTVSLPFKGGEFGGTAIVRLRDDKGHVAKEESFKVLLRATVASVETIRAPEAA